MNKITTIAHLLEEGWTINTFNCAQPNTDLKRVAVNSPNKDKSIVFYFHTSVVPSILNVEVMINTDEK